MNQSTFPWITVGDDVPNDINVYIETPLGSKIKYEHEQKANVLVASRFLPPVLKYPFNYGYVPKTLSEDGDPLDVILISDEVALAGGLVNCRPVGVLYIEDQDGPDPKLIAVPSTKMSAVYDDIQSVNDLPNAIAPDAIERFFNVYKLGLEDKWCKVKGWGDVADAKQLIVDNVDRLTKYHDSL